MKLEEFRIKNFRSIVDSGWIKFSPDGITAFVGQNESGKSSILDALYFSLSHSTPTADDFRVGTEPPLVFIKIKITKNQLKDSISYLKPHEADALEVYLGMKSDEICLEFGWDQPSSTHEKIAYCRHPEEIEELIAISRDSKENLDRPKNSDSPNPDITSENIETIAATTESNKEKDEFSLWDALPKAVLFNEESGRLPDQVDIDEKGEPHGKGSVAAKHFLKIAGIDLPELLKGDRRTRASALNKANTKISEDFNSFWSQTIGKSGKLSLKCEIDNYDSNQSEKVGKPHLVFWICDGSTQLYPKQRSQGVRWFVSFYLQLKASEKQNSRRLFLLDEPGANLHSKAQGDVLKLINKLGKETSTVIYSTHSPQMVEHSKLYRVRAVQRDGDLDESPTTIIDAHQLGTASSDTLSPILTAMGADLSQHQVIRKTNNVLLEEMSGFYYLTAFWKLLDVKQEAHFIAATGVNKIEALANMFRGWGLEFIIAVDDDKQGREVYKQIKRELYGDNDDIAQTKLIKIPGGTGIEDAFSKEDFIRHIIKEPGITYTTSNSEYMRNSGRSKPVAAFHFLLDVESDKINIKDFSEDSLTTIRSIVNSISSRLS